MTTPETEIANLRAALQTIGQFVRHERRYADPTDANALGRALTAIEKMVKQGLRTPRQSRIGDLPRPCGEVFVGGGECVLGMNPVAKS